MVTVSGRTAAGAKRIRGRKLSWPFAVLSAAALVTAGGALTSSAAGVTTVGGSWAFDESSGTVAADGSGNGGHGTIHGPVGLGAPGHQGTAFSFGDAAAWVEVPSSSDVNPGTRDFAVTAWVRFGNRPATGETYDVVRKGLSGTAGGEFKLEIVSTGRAKCLAKDSARVRAAIVGTSPSLADGRWHHIGCARTGVHWQVLVDGVVKSKAAGLGSISNVKSLSVGSQYGKEDPFPGLIDEVTVSYP